MLTQSTEKTRALNVALCDIFYWYKHLPDDSSIKKRNGRSFLIGRGQFLTANNEQNEVGYSLGLFWIVKTLHMNDPSGINVWTFYAWRIGKVQGFL